MWHFTSIPQEMNDPVLIIIIVIIIVISISRNYTSNQLMNGKIKQNNRAIQYNTCVTQLIFMSR